MSFPFEAEKKALYREAGALSFHVEQVSFFAFPLLVHKEKMHSCGTPSSFRKTSKNKILPQVSRPTKRKGGRYRGIEGKGKEISQKVSVA